ncbi:hypothetical protein SynMEDNS5_01096 [Synechococcus sp. MEDNS5]|nr:hypothetical protein SynMEDNS5_01096 [Synechococcus sp. MEDNS5]
MFAKPVQGRQDSSLVQGELHEREPDPLLSKGRRVDTL